METVANQSKYLRRREAGAYLQEKYGFCTPKTLAKLAVTGGGPEFFYAGPRLPLYLPEKLDAWAKAKIGPAVRSTSEHRGVAA